MAVISSMATPHAAHDVPFSSAAMLRRRERLDRVEDGGLDFPFELFDPAQGFERDLAPFPGRLPGLLLRVGDPLRGVDDPFFGVGDALDQTAAFVDDALVVAQEVDLFWRGLFGGGDLAPDDLDPFQLPDAGGRARRRTRRARPGPRRASRPRRADPS